MDKTLNLVIAAYLLNNRRRRHGRRFNVHPLVEKRLLKGEFVSLFSDLRDDEMKFFKYFKMSIRTFEELHAKLEPSLMRCDIYKKPICSRERLAVTIRYLTTGSRMSDLHLSYRLRLSTIKYIIEEVCSLIWEILKNECLPEPDPNFWNKIALGFERDANFPNCIGALDGKHTRITCPQESGSVFFNHKQFYSIILFAMCDVNYCFTYVNVGACGSEADANVFKKSSLFHRLERDDLNLPPPKLLPGTSINPQPHVIVVDAAFGISNTSPIRAYKFDTQKNLFNYRLSRARRYIEPSFGLLTNKFAIFQRSINVSTSFAQILIKACCILHNFIRVRDGYTEEDAMIVAGFTDHNARINDSTRSGNTIRDNFANYFVSNEGSVPWQNSYIY